MTKDARTASRNTKTSSNIPTSNYKSKESDNPTSTCGVYVPPHWSKKAHSSTNTQALFSSKAMSTKSHPTTTSKYTTWTSTLTRESWWSKQKTKATWLGSSTTVATPIACQSCLLVIMPVSMLTGCCYLQLWIYLRILSWLLIKGGGLLWIVGVGRVCVRVKRGKMRNCIVRKSWSKK